MNVIMGGRQVGKSTKLIQISAETGRYILVTNRKRAAMLVKQAEGMGLYIPYPVTLEDFYKSRFDGSYIRKDGIYIDDADDLLKQIFNGIQIHAMTITIDTFENEKHERIDI